MPTRIRDIVVTFVVITNKDSDQRRIVKDYDETVDDFKKRLGRELDELVEAATS